MNKKQIKEVLKSFGYTLINSSYYECDNGGSVFFNAFDENGNVSEFYIHNEEYDKFAKRQRLSSIKVCEAKDVTNWFFK